MDLITTDACPNSNVVQNLEVSKRPTIDTGVVEKMESDLEEIEKVGILFLLAAEFPNAYDTVLRLCKNFKERPCIISEYVQSYPGEWREKLLEALCIIENHEVLYNLGYAEPSALLDKYHSKIPRLTVKVKPSVKVLYKLFDCLNEEKTKLLLQSIYQEGKVVKELDTEYLELHALHWLQQRFITISVDGNANFSNLLKHLKQIGCYSERIYHHVEHFSTSAIRAMDFTDSCSQGKPETYQPHEPTQKVDSQIKVQRNNSRTIKKGLCVIINEVDYETHEFLSSYKNRAGSNNDRDNLHKTFSRRNFDVQIHENLDKRATKELLKKTSEKFDVEKHDCLIVCILSHGYEGGIVTCDGLEIPIKEIEHSMCTFKLRDTIKLLIVQACQGKNIGEVTGRVDLTTDGSRESNPVTMDPWESDLTTDAPSENILRYNNFCQLMSTIDRFASIRHMKDGTWFIEAVCQVLNETETISFTDWDERVQANVQSRTGYVDGVKGASQLPEFKKRLPMTVYFPPWVQG